MPTIRVNRAELSYFERGSGPETIVFAHGLLWDGRMFEPQIASLAPRYRCIAFDFRGQGHSEHTRFGYDMDTLSRDAAALIEGLDAGPCHFVGLSMGGFVGLRLAIRRPALLRSLTLLETAADAEPRRNVPKYGGMALIAGTLGTKPLLGEVMKTMFGKSFLTDPARTAERERLKDRLLAVPRRGAARATMGVIFRRSVERELGQIRIPTLALAGDEDVAVVPARTRRTAEAIPGARFALIPRAGHTSTLEEPAAVTAALSGFLQSL